MAGFTLEKKAQVAVASLPLSPPLSFRLTVRRKINWKTTRRRGCCAVPTAAISARPHISNGCEAAPLSSRAPVVFLLLLFSPRNPGFP